MAMVALKECAVYQMSWGDAGAFENSVLSNPGEVLGISRSRRTEQPGKEKSRNLRLATIF